MKKFFVVLIVSVFFFACNSSGGGTSTKSTISSTAGVAMYGTVPFMVSGVTGVVTDLNVNTVIGGTSTNCDVSGDIGNNLSIHHAVAGEDLTMDITQTYTACTNTISSVCTSKENIVIDGTLTLGVVAPYETVFGTDTTETTNVTITANGTLTFSGSFTGSCVFDNVVITIPASSLTTALTAADYYELAMANITGTVCGVNAATLPTAAASICSAN